MEQHVEVAARPGADGAEPFADTVGVGSYRIDLHPSTAGHGYLDIATYPFQIPLGALLPVRMDNLLAAGKCLGATHITNGCYRLHPVEWNIGEAAGALAAFSLDRRVPPRAVRATEGLLGDFELLLMRLGVQLSWPDAPRCGQVAAGPAADIAAGPATERISSVREQSARVGRTPASRQGSGRGD